MCLWLRLTVMKNVPVSAIEDDLYRSFCRYDERFGRSYFKEVMFNLVELVEERISIEMKRTKGAILHDGWSCSGTHYIGLFASYVTQKALDQNEVVTPLLSVSSMAKICKCADDDCKCTLETTNFDAETHTSHIRAIFSLFGIDCSKWILCQVADNCNLNRAVSSQLRIPHVGCSNHKLNLEVERMVDNDSTLKDCIDSVHRTMTDCRSKLRNRAMLRNLTTLSPIVENKTRWSGKYMMITRFCRIYDSLRTVAENEQSTVAMNLSSGFKNTASRLSKQLGEIDLVTKYLQKEHISLSDCRLALNTLIDRVDKKKTVPNSSLWDCRLGKYAIGESSRLVTHRFFETAVIKLQRGMAGQLSISEKRAVKSFVVGNEPTFDESDSSEDDDQFTVMDELARKKRRMQHTTERNYRDASFVLGSVAIVERLWSLARQVLTDHRKRSTPMVTEALLFLKVNHRYWNESLVCEAMDKTKSDRTAGRLAAEQQQSDLLGH